jgi:hypothetical protein
MTKIAMTGLLLLGSGCCAPGTDGNDDLSWVGGVIGTIIGFGLFFLATYLSSRSSR